MLLDHLDSFLYTCPTKMAVVVRPVQINAFCEASFFQCRLNKSMVKMVDAEFNIEARELMTAPLMAAKINARTPGPTRFLISNG